MWLLLGVFFVSMLGSFMTLGAYDTEEREKKENEEKEGKYHVR